ncbi:unnamed protein product [Lasius platythorax]|uniref:Protein sleepless n=1 Tax=Lasius platythorax TaxID=488582 RepID=A0AAV2P8Y5_9HYME
MEIRSFVITILIVALTILQSGEAKRCYVCDSRNSSTCADGPLNGTIRNCPAGLNCATCNYRVSNGTKITVRRCYFMTPDDSQSIGSGDCNMCSEELCNYPSMANNHPNTANTVTISMAALGCLVSFWAIRFVLTDSY